MDFIIEAYFNLINDLINTAERDSLDLTGKEFEDAQDSIITLRAHLVQVKVFLEHAKEMKQ